MTIDDTVEFCKLIDGKVDIIHVSNGLKWIGARTHQFTTMYDAHGFNAPLAARIKKAVTRSKVGVIGGINSPELADQIIASGQADFVILARQAFADPEFPNKAATGREDLIRRCVRCFHCYPGGFPEHETELPFAEFMAFVRPLLLAQVGQCAINPVTNFHIDPEEYPHPAGSRKVLVVGGGVAGMQAAITASERGHRVTLAERSNVLGGILNFTDRDAYKADLRDFKNVLIREIETRGIDVLTNTEITGEFVRDFRPDAVILAVGSSPVRPAIPGIEHAMDALELYRDQDRVGRRVVMVGGGLVGCEAGLHLAATGHEVTIVEILDRIAPETFAMPRVALLDEMDRRGVRQFLGHRCVGILPNGVRIVSNEGDESFLEADTICYSVGMEARGDMFVTLRAAAGGAPVFEVGDCACVGKVANATESAYKAAMQIV